jgi:hypothetical protein
MVCFLACINRFIVVSKLFFFAQQLCVTSKFPNSAYTSVGGLLFLRYLCPALLQPQQPIVAADGECFLDFHLIQIVSIR